ncbi:MAG: serine/threonine-protein kinase, partial [Pseudomonadota bacterium]
MSLNLRLLERLRRSLSGGRSAPDGAARFQPGARLADRYVIQRVLGAGANGQVFLAHDESLATPVALKALAPALLASESAQQRLKQEVLAARTVSHPNVCRVHDLVELDEDLLVSMAYLEGETLSEHLDRRGLERGDALRILRQIIAGLTAIHDQQVVHGDIKASNVMLSGGQAVITDFGLARPVRPDADGSAFEGTPLYMAPEQISGGPLSPATDVFALGVLIYRMFVGRWPFLDSSPLSTALKRLHSSPEHTAELEQAAGPALAQLVLRCLHPDPAKRCSLRDLDQELRQTTAAPAAAPARRARWVWAGGALGLALVAAGV